MGEPILILEDSRLDRSRFRRLLETAGIPFEFAWKWQSDDGCGVLPWFLADVPPVLVAPYESLVRDGARGRALLDLLGSSAMTARHLLGFRLLLVDLAWSNHSERVMQELQLMDRKEASSWADADQAAGIDAANAKGGLERLITEVEGIGLLEYLRLAQSRGMQVPAAWVTSAYLPMSAAGLRAFLEKRYGLQGSLHLFHKWIDEEVLVRRLQDFLRETIAEDEEVLRVQP